jgi:hypothetical protein
MVARRTTRRGGLDMTSSELDRVPPYGDRNPVTAAESMGSIEFFPSG